MILPNQGQQENKIKKIKIRESPKLDDSVANIFLSLIKNSLKTE